MAIRRRLAEARPDAFLADLATALRSDFSSGRSWPTSLASEIAASTSASRTVEGAATGSKGSRARGHGVGGLTG